MRKFEIKPNDQIEKCPKCGNNTKFTAHSRQEGEDYCNVWVVCVCSFDPTEECTDYRLEDTWGGTDPDNVQFALSCWNDAIVDLFSTQEARK